MDGTSPNPNPNPYEKTKTRQVSAAFIKGRSKQREGEHHHPARVAHHLSIKGPVRMGLICTYTDFRFHGYKFFFVADVRLVATIDYIPAPRLFYLFIFFLLRNVNHTNSKWLYPQKCGLQ